MNTQSQMHLNRQRGSDPLIVLEGSVSGSGKSPLTSDLRKTGLHPDNWYPLARSRDLKKGKMLGVSFAGNPIVIVRTENGMVYALEDRCAHRQVPLHCGIVHGGYVQCGYHSWTFDRTGRCMGVPYIWKSNQPRPAGVRSFLCREAYGLVFVFPGTVSRVNEIGLPNVSLADDPQYKTRYLRPSGGLPLLIHA